MSRTHYSLPLWRLHEQFVELLALSLDVRESFSTLAQRRHKDEQLPKALGTWVRIETRGAVQTVVFKIAGVAVVVLSFSLRYTVSGLDRQAASLDKAGGLHRSEPEKVVVRISSRHLFISQSQSLHFFMSIQGFDPILYGLFSATRSPSGARRHRQQLSTTF